MLGCSRDPDSRAAALAGLTFQWRRQVYSVMSVAVIADWKGKAGDRASPGLLCEIGRLGKASLRK